MKSAERKNRAKVSFFTLIELLMSYKQSIRFPVLRRKRAEKLERKGSFYEKESKILFQNSS